MKLFFFFYLFTYSFLDLLIPICDNQANSLILGVMSTIKVLIPNLYNSKIQESDLNIITDKLLQVKFFRTYNNLIN